MFEKEKEIKSAIVKKKGFFNRGKAERINVNPNSLDKTTYNGSGKFTSNGLGNSVPLDKNNQTEAFESKGTLKSEEIPVQEKKVENKSQTKYQSKKEISLSKFLIRLCVYAVFLFMFFGEGFSFITDDEGFMDGELTTDITINEDVIEDIVIDENSLISENYDSESGVYLLGDNYTNSLYVGVDSLPPGDYRVTNKSEIPVEIKKEDTPFKTSYRTQLEQNGEEMHIRLHEGSTIRVLLDDDYTYDLREVLVELLPVDSLPEVSELNNNMNGDYKLSGNQFTFKHEDGVKMKIFTSDGDLHYVYAYSTKTLIREINKIKEVLGESRMYKDDIKVIVNTFDSDPTITLDLFDDSYIEVFK